MNQCVFSIRDSKANVFFHPFYQPTREVALRIFDQMANDQDTIVGRNPEDFTLYELGEFDAEKGVITMHELPVNLGIAKAAWKPHALNVDASDVREIDGKVYVAVDPPRTLEEEKANG